MFSRWACCSAPVGPKSLPIGPRRAATVCSLPSTEQREARFLKGEKHGVVSMRWRREQQSMGCILKIAELAHSSLLPKFGGRHFFFQRN